MKHKLLLALCFLIFLVDASAQKIETFDIISFKTPQGWQKEVNKNAVQFGAEDKATGGSCLITMFKPLPGSNDPKVNFESAWETIVKETVTVAGKPQMQSPQTENGWTAESGLSQYKAGGAKGLVLLVTLTGQSKMVNILILTDSEKFQQGIAEFLESVDLPKIAVSAVESKPKPSEIPQTARKSSFKFTTSNFDDGWTSTEQEDWVSVTKGTSKVLIHYPNQAADKYNSVVMDGLKNAWDILVAPRYSSATNMQFRPITGWQSIEFAESDLVEKASGKKVYVVLFKMNYSNGSGRYLEFIMPNKASFEREFGAYSGNTTGWERMEKMATYNKFAVAASDLNGKWSNKFSGMIQYANIYTGADAGADTHASAENFAFGVGNTYKWDLAVASGMVGNIKFQSIKSSGKFSVPNNWQVKFSDIEGKPRTYNTSFSAVKGARILWLDGTAYGKIQ